MKDSFVFRKEWKDAVSGMSAEMRLEFYEAVIEYATTGNEPDLKPMARLAFNFAKTSLDRDSEKYEETRQKRSEAGKLGNEKRWGKKDEVIANATSPSQNIAKVANIADNVSVYDSVSVKEKEELSIESKKKEETPSFTKSRDGSFEEKFFSNEIQLEQFIISLGLRPEKKGELRKMADEILNEWELTEQIHLNYNDFARHLMNTIRIKVREAGKGVNPKQEELRQAASIRQKDSEDLMKRLNEMKRNSVSYEDAKNSEEYRRALAEA